MTSRDFVYWLQGFFEVSKATALTSDQIDIVRRHLNLVFEHEIDPSIDKADPVKMAKLSGIHASGGGSGLRC